MRQLQQAASTFLLARAFVACTSLDPNAFGPPRPGTDQIGMAGWSYDADSGSHAGHDALGRGGGSSGGRGGSSSTGTVSGASSKGAAGHESGAPFESGGEAGGASDAGEGGAAMRARGDRPSGEEVGSSPRGGDGGSAMKAGAGGSTVSASAGNGGASGRGGGGGKSAQAGTGSGGSRATGGGGSVAGGRGGVTATGGLTAAGGHAGATAAAGRGDGTGGLDGTNGGAAAAGGNSGAQNGGAPPFWFSEYVEGSGDDKALELHAPPGADLGGCALATYYNGSTKPSTTSLEGIVGTAGVYVLCSASVANVVTVHCDRSTKLNYNGNDAVALVCNGVVFDVIGQIGVDPGDGWNNAGASTLNRTLRRRCGVTQGDADGSDAFDPASEWVSLPVDTLDGLGSPDCG